MKKLIRKSRFIIIFLAVFVFMQSCTKKLDLTPNDQITAGTVYSTAAGYKQALAGLYGSLAMIGNQGPSGSSDIPSAIVSDAGSTDFLRQNWYLQSLSTDEAGWTYSSNTDPLYIHQMSWDATNQAVAGEYYKCLYTITACNAFIAQCSASKLSGTDAANVGYYKSEARFLRAYNYWVLLDLFGNPPFATDTSYTIGSSATPPQIKSAALFSWLESELKAIDGSLVAPMKNEYGRADQAAEWALLARMYLNAGTYTGTTRYSDAITYCNKITAAGYSLISNYKNLMLADNQLNTNEFIFTINYDATNTQTWGGTTVLTHGPAGVPGSVSGTNGTWNCIRVTQQFVGLFPNDDIRGQFYTTGQNLIMATLLGDPTQGYSSSKFRNVTRTGAADPNADASGNFSSIDFPVFRLAEIYLIYAESVLRGGNGGSSAQAQVYLDALNLRSRPSASSSTAQLNLAYIINERARELFWEGFRRTDLIRFGEFTTNLYLWAWKGGIANGTAVDSHFNLYPIPATDLGSNPNLVQNPGY
jgi:hypothetical protein